jgi:antitoxin component YwqK of YwqJK toxin-antitoxin module
MLELNNGLRHGKYEFYYSGVRYLSATYVNGRLEGECIKWYEEYVGSNPPRQVKTVTQFHRDKRISFIRYDVATGKVIE